MLSVCGGMGVKKPAESTQEAPPALGPGDWEGLPGTQPVGGHRGLSAGNGVALDRGWVAAGRSCAEAGCCARRVAGRLGWHRHQLPVPLAQRARGGCGRRLLQSTPLPVPVRARQGEASQGFQDRVGWARGVPQPPLLGRCSFPPRRRASCTAATAAT